MAKLSLIFACICPAFSLFCAENYQPLERSLSLPHPPLAEYNASDSTGEKAEDELLAQADPHLLVQTIAGLTTMDPSAQPRSNRRRRSHTTATALDLKLLAAAAGFYPPSTASHSQIPIATLRDRAASLPPRPDLISPFTQLLMRQSSREDQDRLYPCSSPDNKLYRRGSFKGGTVTPSTSSPSSSQERLIASPAKLPSSPSRSSSLVIVTNKPPSGFTHEGSSQD